MSRTMWVITLVTASVIGYDIFTVVTSGYISTISWTLYTMSESYPILAFGFGVLFGHCLWPVDIRGAMGIPQPLRLVKNPDKT